MENEGEKQKVLFRTIEDCEIQEWNSSLHGQVKWWELINGDVTPTTGITMGIAEVPVGAARPSRGHSHDAEEVYYFLSGTGRIYVNGVPTDVKSGTTIWIPANTEHFCDNTGTEPLKILYVFARDKFSDIHYSFPGETESKSS